MAKKKSIALLMCFFMLHTAGISYLFAQGEQHTVSGRVYVQGGSGIENVVVTDGYLFAATDKDGNYTLPSSKAHGYVYISIPSGYEPAGREGIVTPFFKYTTQNAATPETINFELTKVDNTNHTLLVMTDGHFINDGDKRGKNDIAQAKSLLLPELKTLVSEHRAQGKPIYGLSLGDMVEEIYWDSFGYTDYISLMKEVDMPFFHTMGNHEYSATEAGDWNTAKEYKKKLGPTYYSFNLGAVHYIVIDNMTCTNPGDGKKRSIVSEVDQDQLDWIKKNLSYVDKNTPVVLALHVPAFRKTVRNGLESYSLSSGNWDELNRLFSGYREVYYLSGHTHVNNSAQIGNILERNIAAVSGSWWFTARSGYSDRHICNDGSPGGYQLFDMKGDAVSWVYKGLNLSKDKQFRTYDRNQIHITADKYCPDASPEMKKNFDAKLTREYAQASTDNYVYINIWAWDPKWRLEVREKGLLLPYTKISTHDPLKILAYEAMYTNKGERVSGYASANYTPHFFRVKASAPDTSLEIKVTDRFGNTYTETMIRPKAFHINMD